MLMRWWNRLNIKLGKDALIFWFILAGIGFLIASSSSPTINGVDESGKPVSFPNPERALFSSIVIVLIGLFGRNEKANEDNDKWIVETH